MALELVQAQQNVFRITRMKKKLLRTHYSERGKSLEVLGRRSRLAKPYEEGRILYTYASISIKFGLDK